MSEKTIQNSQESVDLCFGMMGCDEKGNIQIPPEYAYKISFNEKDCMVIPLEGAKHKKKAESNKKSNKTEENGMEH